MTVWGVAVRIDRGQPVAIAVELSGSPESPTAREVLRHRCAEADRALGLLELANDVDHQLSKGAPDVVVIRSPDFFRGSIRENVGRPRLQAEGVLLQVARARVGRVEAASGRDIGDWCGSSKATVEAQAHELFPALDQDAVMAALGALAIAED